MEIFSPIIQIQPHHKRPLGKDSEVLLQAETKTAPTTISCGLKKQLNSVTKSILRSLASILHEGNSSPTNQTGHKRLSGTESVHTITSTPDAGKAFLASVLGRSSLFSRQIDVVF